MSMELRTVKYIGLKITRVEVKKNVKQEKDTIFKPQTASIKL